MRSLPAPLLALALLMPVLSTPARADEVTDQIEQARRYYDEGDITGAIAELEFALQAMRGRIGQALLATFPEAPAGWTAEPASEGEQAAIPMMGSGTMLSRVYNAEGGQGRIEAQLMTGGGFLQGLAGMFMNPQVLAAQPNAKRVRVERENAVVTYDPEARSSQLVLDVGGKATIMLQGENLESGDPLVELVQKWDIKQVKSLVGG